MTSSRTPTAQGPTMEGSSPLDPDGDLASQDDDGQIDVNVPTLDVDTHLADVDG